MNTFGWYNKHNLDSSYDSSNKLAAMEKAMEFNDKIPLGILYQEPKKTYHQKNTVLKTGIQLLDQVTDSTVVKNLLKEFI